MERPSDDALEQGYNRAFYLGYPDRERAIKDFEWLQSHAKTLPDGVRVEYRIIEDRVQEANPERPGHWIVVLHDKQETELDWEDILAALGGRTGASDHGKAGPGGIRQNIQRSALTERFEIRLTSQRMRAQAGIDTLDEPEPAAPDGDRSECDFCSVEIGSADGLLSNILEGGSGIHAISRMGQYCRACDKVTCNSCSLTCAKSRKAAGFICPSCGGPVESYEPS